MKTIVRKMVSGAVAASIAISGIAAVPALAFAKENHGAEVSAKAKINHGQTMKLGAHLKGNFEGKNENNNKIGLGIHGFLDPSVTVSSDLKIFKKSLKQAKTDKKTADKTAKTTFKASVKAAATPAEKTSALKIYLNSLLSAFHSFSVAKEAAFTLFINSL